MKPKISKNLKRTSINESRSAEQISAIEEHLVRAAVRKIIKETIEPTEVILDVDEPEYETYEYNNKKYYKIGITGNLNKRLKVYNTSQPNKIFYDYFIIFFLNIM